MRSRHLRRLHLIRREDAPLRAMKDLQQLVERALRIPEFRFRGELKSLGYPWKMQGSGEEVIYQGIRIR